MKSNIFIHLFLKRASNKLFSTGLSRGNANGHFDAKRMSLLVILCFLFLMMSFNLAVADMVYGHVYCDQCPAQITLIFINDNNPGIRITTDNNKNYSVFLPPGSYRVEYDGSYGKMYGNIQSYSSPVRQDIYLVR